MPVCQRAAKLFSSIRSSLVALACYALGASATAPAASAALHPTLSVSAQTVGFYAGHVVLDARGEADLNDGVVRVQADRIIVDLRANRYVAAGHVIVTGLNIERGDALGVDLASHEGVLLAAGASSPRLFLHGAVPSESAPATPPQEPLALPDTGFEQPYAVAKRAVAHLDADVRLAGARIIVPGGQSVPLPSYVFTFSSDPGYVVTNINTSGEDIPIYYGSTPNSIQGVHFCTARRSNWPSAWTTTSCSATGDDCRCSHRSSGRTKSSTSPGRSTSTITRVRRSIRPPRSASARPTTTIFAIRSTGRSSI